MIAKKGLMWNYETMRNNSAEFMMRFFSQKTFRQNDYIVIANYAVWWGYDWRRTRFGIYGDYLIFPKFSKTSFRDT
jgi:hypothetical protein